MHPGHGPGLSQRSLGATGGAETVTLTTSELPAHAHTVTGVGRINQLPEPPGPDSEPPSADATGQLLVSAPGAGTPTVAMTSTGGALPHNNMPPFGAVNYIIATAGVYPSRQ
jgi:microcystin-dependent protein